MKLTELRLGNLVLHYETVCKLTAILKTHFQAVDENGIDCGPATPENYQPIPLSEEWLRKFYFICDYPSIVYYRNRFHINLDWVIYLDQQKILQIKYVHELQNLYFALTGLELEIK